MQTSRPTIVSALAIAAAILSVATADVAYAKSDNANGGNSENAGSNGKSDENKGRGQEQRAAKGESANNPGKKGGLGQGIANALGLSKPKPGKPAAAQTVVAYETEETVIKGKSWKTRIEGGVLATPANQLGPWNSAKRSPVAIANMIAKYDPEGTNNGMSGKIGFIGYSFGEYNGQVEAVQAAFDTLAAYPDVTAADLQYLVDNGVPLQTDLDGQVVDLNTALATDPNGPIDAVISYDGTDYGCTGTACGDYEDELADLNAAQDALNAYDAHPVETQAALDANSGLSDAEMALDTAVGDTIQPRSDFSLTEQMQQEVLQLLGMEKEEVVIADPV